MIVSVRNWMPMALPRRAWRVLKAGKQTREPREARPSLLQSWQQLLEQQADLAIRQMEK